MKRTFCILLCFALCLCAGCGKEAKQSKTLFAMDTVMELTAWGEDAQTALTQAQTLLQQLESTWSAQENQSLLSKINKGSRPELTGEQADLLARVEDLKEYTSGAFDPKLGMVSSLWGFTDDVHAIPDEQDIEQALQAGYWDLGAALKGYAGQQLALLLEQFKVDRALLNLGGNIQTYGEKPDGTPWNIGIQNPNGGDPVGTVAVTGTASIVTSGDYQRYFELEGVRYHHILDPKTGYPADSGLRSVTVICKDGLKADALSTALFVMGLEEAVEFWRQTGDFEAVFITTEGKVYATVGANFSGCETEVIAYED